MPFVVYIFYFWILSIYFERFLLPKKLPRRRKLIIWMLFFIAQLLVLSQIREALLLFVANFLLTALIGYTLYHGSVKKVLFLSAIGCAVGMLTEIFVAFSLQLFENSLESSIAVGLIASRLLLLSMVHAVSIRINA